ncbi:MAG TPA: energy transducer TonB [Pyrinomonadaceae bacterium]
MCCFSKRVLPFALTLFIGLLLGTLFSRAPRPFNPRDVDRKAQVLSRSEPKYTEEARKNLVEGVVVLSAVVAEDGSVRSIKVLSGLPDGLTEKAVEAARETEFSPALKDGRAVSQSIQLEYDFHLKKPNG